MNHWVTTIQNGAATLAESDPTLAEVIAVAPLPTITPHRNYYQAIVESIISQQLSVKAAATILKRFVALFSDGFPEPKAIIELDDETYRAVGLSRQKARYIKDLAAKVIDGSVQFSHFDSLSNHEIITELTQVKGVGVWTVHMFLIFCMGRLDVLPTGDLGIRNGIQKLYNLPERPGDAEITEIALRNNWHPYESLASWYIWHSLDNKSAL